MLSCQLERGSGLLSLHLEPCLLGHLASLAYQGISFLRYNIIEIFVDLGFVVIMVVSLTCELKVMYKQQIADLAPLPIALLRALLLSASTRPSERNRCWHIDVCSSSDLDRSRKVCWVRIKKNKLLKVSAVARCPGLIAPWSLWMWYTQLVHGCWNVCSEWTRLVWHRLRNTNVLQDDRTSRLTYFVFGYTTTLFSFPLLYTLPCHYQLTWSINMKIENQSSPLTFDQINKETQTQIQCR